MRVTPLSALGHTYIARLGKDVLTMLRTCEKRSHRIDVMDTMGRRTPKPSAQSIAAFGT